MTLRATSNDSAVCVTDFANYKSTQIQTALSGNCQIHTRPLLTLGRQLLEERFQAMIELWRNTHMPTTIHTQKYTFYTVPYKLPFKCQYACSVILGFVTWGRESKSTTHTKLWCCAANAPLCYINVQAALPELESHLTKHTHGLWLHFSF